MQPNINRSGCLTAALFAILFSWQPAVGQSQPPPLQGQPQPPGVATTRPAASSRDIVWQMTEKLKLDEKQQEKAKQIVAENRDKTLAIRKQMSLRPEFSQKMREVMEEMRAAQASNDMDRLREISEKVRKMRQEHEEQLTPLRRQLDEAQDAMERELRALLRPDQLEGFDDLWSRRTARGPWNFMQRRNPEALKEAVEQLSDLNPEQKKQIEKLFKTFEEAQRSKEPSGAAVAANVRMESRLFDDVLGQLTPKQRGALLNDINGLGGGRRATTQPRTLPPRRPQTVP